MHSDKHDRAFTFILITSEKNMLNVITVILLFTIFDKRLLVCTIMVQKCLDVWLPAFTNELRIVSFSEIARLKQKIIKF